MAVEPLAKKVLYVDVSGHATGSNASLRVMVQGLDRERFAPIMVFGDCNNAERWRPENIYEFKFAGFDNFDYFPASWDVRWLYHTFRFLVHFPLDILSTFFLLKKLRPAVVHINCGQAVTFGIVAKVCHYPVVWHVRELVARNFLGGLQDHLYRICSDRVIVPSQAVAERLPHSRGKVVQIPNAVSPVNIRWDDVVTFRKGHGIEDGDLVILLLGNVSIVKGYLFLAEVAEQLDDGLRAKFLLGGNYEDPEASLFHKALRKVYRAAKGHEGEKRIILDRWQRLVKQGRAAFTGYVQAEVSISASDIVVCPNQVWEPFGRTVIEANAQSKPVIASAVPAFTELIDHNRTGWLLPVAVGEWVKTITQLYHDRELLKEAGHAALLSSQRYIADIHLREIMNAYEDVIRSY